MHAHHKSSAVVAIIGIDMCKNTFHLVGLDKRGAIVLRAKVSRTGPQTRSASTAR